MSEINFLRCGCQAAVRIDPCGVDECEECGATWFSFAERIAAVDFANIDGPKIQFFIPGSEPSPWPWNPPPSPKIVEWLIGIVSSDYIYPEDDVVLLSDPLSPSAFRAQRAVVQGKDKENNMVENGFITDLGYRDYCCGERVSVKVRNVSTKPLKCYLTVFGGARE